MGHFVKADLEECVKELAERVRCDLEGMTPLQRSDYFLCHSIEHLISVQTWEAPVAVIDIESRRQERSRCPAASAREWAGGDLLTEDATVLAFRKSG